MTDRSSKDEIESIKAAIMILAMRCYDIIGQKTLEKIDTSLFPKKRGKLK